MRRHHDGAVRVLVIDDEKNIRTTLAVCLEGLGCQVMQAATSQALNSPTESAIRSAISDFISGPYTDFKTKWSGLHERVSSINDVVQRVDAAITGITLPGVVPGVVSSCGPARQAPPDRRSLVGDLT